VVLFVLAMLVGQWLASRFEAQLAANFSLKSSSLERATGRYHCDKAIEKREFNTRIRAAYLR
jgi:hypothetical protein